MKWNWNPNDSGMTIVEVLVSFLLLGIALAFLGQAILLTGNIQKRIFLERRDLSEASRSYYLNGQPEISEQTMLEFTTDQGETVLLPVVLRGFQEGKVILYDVRPDTERSSGP